MAKLDRDATVLDRQAYARIGDLLILCTQGPSSGENAVSARDFDAWIARLGVNDFAKILIDDRGGPPSAKQRARIADFWKTSGRTLPKVVLLTDSAVTRCVMTALEWILNSPTKCLPHEQVDQALAWLDFKGSAAQVTFMIHDLHDALNRQRERPALRV